MGARVDRRLDDDAIWRGEIPDDQIIMTAAEHRRIATERELAARRRRLVELFGEPVGAVAEQGEAFRHRRRSDAQRGGVPLDQRRSAGCREEIQVTMLCHPVTAVELIADHDLLSLAPRIEVDRSTEQRLAKQIAWDAVLRTTPCTSRPARLRLYGSPSSNVTVLTLTPRRSRRLGVRMFLGAGLASLSTLRDAVEARTATHSGRT